MQVGVKVRVHDLLTPALDELEPFDVSCGCVTTEERVPCTLTQEGGLSSQTVSAS